MDLATGVSYILMLFLSSSFDWSGFDLYFGNLVVTCVFSRGFLFERNLTLKVVGQVWVQFLPGFCLKFLPAVFAQIGYHPHEWGTHPWSFPQDPMQMLQL